MTKRFWFAGALLLLVGMAGLGYYLLRAAPPVSALVPADALLELESYHLLDSTSGQRERRFLTINQLPLFGPAASSLARPLFALADSADVRRFLRGKAVRGSLHPTGKDALQFLFFIPLASDADRQFVGSLLRPGNRRLRVLTRLFDGERISELIDLRNVSLGHFMVTDQQLVVSSSGVLLENAARQRQRTAFLRTAHESSGAVEQLAGLTVRPEVVQRLLGSENGSFIRLFLPERLHFHFRPTASPTHLAGYASDQIGERTAVAALFQHQAPQRITTSGLIPQSTSSVFHISVSDRAAFGESVSRLLLTSADSRLQRRLARMAPETAAFYGAIGTDLLLCRLESTSGHLRQVLVVQDRNGAALSRAYQQLAFRAGARGTASVKSFLGHKLLRLSVAELPASLFTSLFSGFRESWVTRHGEALLVANSEEVLQDYLRQLAQHQVWASDEQQADLLARTLRPANFTAFIRLNRGGTSRSNRWPAGWQHLLGPSLNGQGSLENMVYQASYGRQKIISTLVLGRTSPRASGALVNKVLLRRKVAFNAPLTAAPVVVGNLSDGSAQFYAQNKAGQFVLLTPEGAKLVQDTTDGPIRSNVIATDLLENGRLQYLFMTGRQLYAAQPGKESVKLTRLPLPEGIDPSFLTQPRGSRQQSIVALAAHRNGHIYALDRQRRLFRRLTTAARPGPLLLPFQVIDTPTGMEVLALQRNGTLNRWREDGTPVPGYPILLKSSFAGPTLQPAGESYIQTVTEAGELLRLDKRGAVSDRNQLYRPIRNGSFALLPDVNLQTWLLLRSSDTEAAILDQQGDERFAVRGLQPGKTTIRYHRPGGGLELISIKSGPFTTLYSLDGKRVGDRPIPGDFPVALQFDELTNELYILTGLEKAVQLFSIRIR